MGEAWARHATCESTLTVLCQCAGSQLDSAGCVVYRNRLNGSGWSPLPVPSVRRRSSFLAVSSLYGVTCTCICSTGSQPHNTTVSQSDCASTLVAYRSFRDVLVQSVVLTISIVVLAHVQAPLRFYVVFIAVWSKVRWTELLLETSSLICWLLRIKNMWLPYFICYSTTERQKI
jgi:hypothetical protein